MIKEPTVCPECKSVLIEDGDEHARSLSDRRYEAVRRLSPREFTELYRLNLSSGKSFDSLVDKLSAGRLTL